MFGRQATSGGAFRMSAMSLGNTGSSVRASTASRVSSGVGGYSGGGGYSSGGMAFGGSAGSSFGGALAGGGGFGGADDSIIGNEKFAMQDLNTRLANYLAKVAQLEKANAELELKIKNFLESKAGPSARDYSAYYATIADLLDKIQKAVLDKGTVLLAIDNAQLALDDFRVKYENELAMRQSVEADIAGLKMLQGDLNAAMKDLTMQIDSLKDELETMKRNHEEDLLSMRNQMSGQVNVEVDTPTQPDLTKLMEEMRDQYQAMADKQSRELADWYQAQSAEITKEVAETEMTIQTTSTEMKELKSQLQALEIELQSQLSMKASLENTLAEIQARYANRLVGFQMQVTSLEEQLVQLRNDLERQGQEYQMLLDIKTKLEMEISEYRRLLDSEGANLAQVSGTTTSKAIIRVVEE
ncbi:keratin, type I cytoskeletal 13-like [Pholidichthys leucotaenia]